MFYYRTDYVYEGYIVGVMVRGFMEQTLFELLRPCIQPPIGPIGKGSTALESCTWVGGVVHIKVCDGTWCTIREDSILWIIYGIAKEEVTGQGSVCSKVYGLSIGSRVASVSDGL